MSEKTDAWARQNWERDEPPKTATASVEIEPGSSNWFFAGATEYARRAGHSTLMRDNQILRDMRNEALSLLADQPDYQEGPNDLTMIAADLTEPQRRVIRHAYGRPDYCVCPTKGIFAAAQTALLKSLHGLGLITNDGGPVLTAAGVLVAKMLMGVQAR